MARIGLMDLEDAVVRNRSGDALSNQSVRLLTTLGAAATVYAASAGGSGTAPTYLKTDRDGRLNYYVDEDTYSLVYTSEAKTFTRRLSATTAGAGGVSLSAVNTWTARQTFESSVTRIRWISVDGSSAPELHFIAKNGSGPNSEAWGIGIDTAAATPSRDFALFKHLPVSGVRDFLYISHNGAAEPQLGVSWNQPADQANLQARVNAGVAFDGSGNATEPAVAALVARGAAGMTAPVFAVKDRASAAELMSVFIDGSVTQKSAAGTTRWSYDGASGKTAVFANANTDDMHKVHLSGEAEPRLALRPGTIAFGAGGATAVDSFLTRGNNPSTIFTTDTELRAFRATAGNPGLATAVTGDANRRWQARASGDLVWGSGAASPDIFLQRLASTNGVLLAISKTGSGMTPPSGMDGAGIFLGNVTTAPTGNPTGGGVLYSVAGALTWKGSSGTITTVAPA